MLLGLLAIPLSDNARNPFMGGILLAAAVMAFWLWAGFALAVKRLHDLDKPGWHYVWMFLLPVLLGSSFTIRWNGPNSGHWTIGVSAGQVFAIVPLLATLYLMFARGSDGPNRYGYPP